MSTPRFDLVDITHTIRDRRRFIIIVVIISMILGGAVWAIRKTKYKAETEFFLSNPLYADRNYLFRSHDMHFVDYFAGDDDIDKIIVTAESDMVKDKVIENMKLSQAYKIDMRDQKGKNKMKDFYNHKFKIKRSEYRHLILSYTDTDPIRAAEVANEHVRVTEQTFREYYNTIKGYAFTSIQDKIKEMDSTINNLTDTLAGMRDQYKLYDITSPSRLGAAGSVHSGGGAGYGKAVEQIQNIASIKDQLVIDRAKYIGLLNEFSTGTKDNELKFIQVANYAVAPSSPTGLNLPLTVIAAAFVGLFFAVMYILLMTYYRKLIAEQR